MQTIGGFTVTGRQFGGPAADLVEMSNARGLRHTAIVFHQEFHGHSILDVGVVAGFLESPLVPGLCELVHRDHRQGTFIYPTGECWSVAEMVRALADAGSPEGHIRAGLELMHEAGNILVEAAERGEMDAVYSHGGLTPWRVMLKKDGQVQIIGHGIPQVEILLYAQNSQRVPREDSFRYCPPERILRQPENISSDLFCLALIAFELMTGKPVYDGLMVDIQQQASRGAGSSRLHRFRDKLPQRVRDLLHRTLQPNMGDRFPSGNEFLDQVRHALSSSEVSGGPLVEVVGRVSGMGSRPGQPLTDGKTIIVNKDELRQRLDEQQTPPARQSWTPASRTPAPTPAPVEEIPAPTPAPTPAEEPGNGKWSRPTRTQRTVSRGEPPSLGETPGTGASATAAADILETMRSSAANISPDHAAARELGRKSAQDVVSAILGTGGPPPIAPLPPPPLPEPAPERPPVPFTPSGEPRRPRTNTSSANNIAEMLTQSLANLSGRRTLSPEAIAEQRVQEEAERVQAEARLKAEADAARRRTEEDARRLAAEVARQQAAAAEVARQQAAAEEAARQQAAAEEAARQQAAAEEAALRRAIAEEEQDQRRLEAAARQQAAVEAARQKVAAEAAEVAQKKAAEAAALEAAARRKAILEEAARKKAAAEVQEAERRQAEAAAARAVATAEEAARQQAAAAQAESQRKAAAEAERQRKALEVRVAALEAELTQTRAQAAEQGEALSAALAAAVQERVLAATRALVDAETARWSAVQQAVLSAVESAAAQARAQSGAGEGGGAGLASAVAQAVTGALAFAGAETLERPPDIINLPSGKTGVATFNFQRGVGGRMIRIRLPLDATTAEAVAFLLGNALPIRTDLVGRITGWYRLEDEGRRIPAAWRLEKLDPQKTYVMQFVQNEVRHADIEIQGAATPARFVAPVGIAVPVVTLVDHLAAWLALPPGEWGLEMDGRPLALYDILADVRLGQGLLHLKMGPRT